MSGMPRGGAKEKRFRCSTKQKALEGEFHLLAFDQWHLQVLADAPPITKLACLGQGLGMRQPGDTTSPPLVSALWTVVWEGNTEPVGCWDAVEMAQDGDKSAAVVGLEQREKGRHQDFLCADLTEGALTSPSTA